MKKQFMYHSTDKKNKTNILKNGLLVNHHNHGFTEGGSWAYEVYGGIPIFLSSEKDRFYSDNSVVFKVDVTDINLLADLPSLIDFGAYLEEDMTMWWDNGKEPLGFDVLNDDGISAYDIVSSKDLNNSAIKLTGTAAVMENIPVENIILIKDSDFNERFSNLKEFKKYYKSNGTHSLAFNSSRNFHDFYISNRKRILESFYKLANKKIIKKSNQEKIKLINYEIKNGDTIYSISLKLFSGHAKLARDFIIKENKITDERKLQIGQIIRIPSSLSEFVNYFKLEENKSLKASDYILNYIKKKEGFLSIPKDIEKKGIYTIGYGRYLNTSKKKDEYSNVKKILLSYGRKDGALSESDSVVLLWFKQDIEEAERVVQRKALPRLKQHQYDALVSVAFNTGDVPDIIEDLKLGRITSAASKIKNFRGRSSMEFSGLAQRRAEEAKIFLSGY